MKGKWMKLIAAIMYALLMIIVVGCENNNGGNGSAEPPSVDVTGIWDAATSVGENATLTITQSGSKINGTFFSSFGSRGTLSGSVSANTVSLTLNETNFNRVVTKVSGTVVGSTMKGTLRQSDGDSATFTATRR